MADGLAAMGAQKDPSRSAPLNMSTYISGLITQQNPMGGGAVPFIQQKYYSATRYDRLLGGVNAELSVELSLVRAPGSSVYNSSAFARANRFYAFKPIVDGIETIHVMLDTPGNVYDATPATTGPPPTGQLNIWNKSAGAGKTQFQGVGDELFFGNGVDQQKWVLSNLVWKPNMLYDGTATSDEPLGDFIVDPNGFLQQAVGGFTLLISYVSVSGNMLTLTLETSQLADPSGAPTGTAATTGGTLPAGDNYARIAAVDATGNVTEAGDESANVPTTGATSQIAWTWPAVSGAVSYRIYVGTTTGGEDSYFTSNTNSFTQTDPESIVSGTPPTENSTSIDVPDNLFQMVGVQLALSGLTNATWLNGQTITIAKVLTNVTTNATTPPSAPGTTGGTYSNQITAAFTHADYAASPDTGQATSGTGITGATIPTFAKTLWAVTQDGGAQWINRSLYVQNWGIATPAAAPTIYQSLAPSIYPRWQANTTYWRSGFVEQNIDGTYQIFKIITSGITGTQTGEPTWNTSAPGALTDDGTVVWEWFGPSTWSASTSFAKGTYIVGPAIDAHVGDPVYQAQNAGISGTAFDTGTWPGGAGTVVVDGSITWVCVGDAVAYFGLSFSPSVSVSAANTILDSNGYLEQVNDGAVILSGPFQPTWGAVGASSSEAPTATITQVVGSGGTAQFYAMQGWNQLAAGNGYTAPNTLLMTVSGLSVVTQYNGLWSLLEASAQGTQVVGDNGPSSAEVALTADSGTITLALVDVWTNIGAFAPKSITGDYYVYAYKNSVTGHVSSASAKSALIMLRGGYFANVQGFGSADPQVDTIVLYRTADGGSTLLELDEIANPGGGVPFTYQDTLTDVELNFEVQAAINGANNPPLIGFVPSAYHLGRIWGFTKNLLLYSGGPDTLTGSGNEAFPPANVFAMPATITKLRATSIGLLIYTTSDIYIETGLGTSSSPFIPPPTFQEGIGLLSYDAECVNGSTVYMMTSASRVISLDPGAGEVEVGIFIGDQFQLGAFSPSTAYLTFHEGSSEDMALYVSDGQTGWFRMGILAAPESGDVWSPFRAIVGGCGAVQSVEVMPGEKTLLIGPNANGPILQRDYGVYLDDGVAYPMDIIIGSLLLCQPGTVAEVDFVTLDSRALGTKPTVGLLLGELSGLENSPDFFELQPLVRDLPLLPAAKTLYSDRYDVAQQQNQQSCRHLQMKITWPAEGVKTELLTHTIVGTLRPEA
jgi:hypothetical protein